MTPVQEQRGWSHCSAFETDVRSAVMQLIACISLLVVSVGSFQHDLDGAVQPLIGKLTACTVYLTRQMSSSSLSLYRHLSRNAHYNTVYVFIDF